MQIVFSGKQREKFGGKANGVKFRVPAHGEGERLVVFYPPNEPASTHAPPQAATLLLSVPGYAVVEAKPAPAPKSAKE